MVRPSKRARHQETGLSIVASDNNGEDVSILHEGFPSISHPSSVVCLESDGDHLGDDLEVIRESSSPSVSSRRRSGAGRALVTTDLTNAESDSDNEVALIRSNDDLRDLESPSSGRRGSSSDSMSVDIELQSDSEIEVSSGDEVEVSFVQSFDSSRDSVGSQRSFRSRASFDSSRSGSRALFGPRASSVGSQSTTLYQDYQNLRAIAQFLNQVNATRGRSGYAGGFPRGGSGNYYVDIVESAIGALSDSMGVSRDSMRLTGISVGGITGYVDNDATTGATHFTFSRNPRRASRPAREGMTRSEVRAALDRLRIESIETSEAAKDLGTCPICLSDYRSRMTVRVLPCGHRIHKACFDSYSKQTRKLRCPLHNQDFQ